MFCKKCGAELPINASACPVCGEKVASTDTAKKPENAKQKKIITAVAISAGLLMIIAAVIIALVITAKPTINLDDYVIVTFVGENGDGDCEVDFDYDRLNADYGDMIKLSERDELWFDSPADALITKYVNWNIKKFVAFWALSNGDKVTLEWHCDDEGALNEYGIKLKHKDRTITVTGLTESKLENPDTETEKTTAITEPGKTEPVTEPITEPEQTGPEVDPATGYEIVDLFEGLTLSFSGVDGYGKAEIVDNRPEWLKELYTNDYKIATIDTGLKNGDSVKVTLDMGYWFSTSDIYPILAAKQKYPKATEKTYIVEGLKTFPELSDISGDLLSQMKAKAVELFNESIKNWDSANQLIGIEYVGMYVLTPKTGTFSEVDLAYKIRARVGATPQNAAHDIEYYNIARFSGVYKYSDGQIKVEDWDEADIYDSASFLIDNYWRFYGFQDLEWFEAAYTGNSLRYNIQTDIPWVLSIPDFSEITGDFLNQLKETAVQTFNESIKDWNPDNKLLGLEYCGINVFTLPQKQDYGIFNVDVVFKVKAKVGSNWYYSSKEIEYYQYVSFMVFNDANGEIKVLSKPSTNSEHFTVNSFQFDGFRTLEEMNEDNKSFCDKYGLVCQTDIKTN